MMNLCFVLIFYFAATASGNIEKRIVGSQPCKTDRQYHVKIDSVQGGKSCGGALLNTRWVITASHCAEQDVKVTIGVNNKVPFFKKVKAFFKESNKKLEQVIKADQQFTYKDEEGNPHDIMLIKLSEDMSAKLPTINLPFGECKRPDVKQTVQIGGMGLKQAGTKGKPELRCAATQISTCGENDKPDAKYHSDDTSKMCAFRPGVETCFGDGGSAVEYNNALHGIILSDPVDKCANSIVMIDICFYMAWIEETMHKK